VHCTKDYNAAYYQQTKERHAENRQRYRLRVVTENRDRLWALLAESKCADCGESDPVVLEFDHQHSKLDSVGQMVAWARPWRVIEKEIAKCEIVCCNCHQRRTNAQFGWWRGVMGNQVL
jgi:hypothetical protein